MDVRSAERKVNDTADRLADEARSAKARRRVEVEMIAAYHGERRRENLLEWCAFHRRLVAVHERLAEQHRRALGRLIDGGRGGGP